MIKDQDGTWFELSPPLYRKTARECDAVSRWVDDIIAMGGDPEISHGQEDDLLWALAAVYAPDCVLRVLVRLKQADLTRWYA